MGKETNKKARNPNNDLRKGNNEMSKECKSEYKKATEKAMRGNQSRPKGYEGNKCTASITENSGGEGVCYDRCFRASRNLGRRAFAMSEA